MIEVSTTAATLMIVCGLIGMILLVRSLNANARRDAAVELRRERKRLKELTADLERRGRGRGAAVAPSEVREAIESIARCVHVLRTSADDAHAPTLASIERSTTLLASVIDPVPDDVTRSAAPAAAPHTRSARTRARRAPGRARP